MTDELPPGLRPWSGSLAFLTVEAALHIGPLVRRIDALVRGHDATTADAGEPDGYDGLSRRGGPEQLLLSEWLLADELPLEFLRRAASGELMYLRPARVAPQPRGRVAAVFDVGPDQLGAARLVQLAALVVLHRRAASRGSELVVGLLGEPADRWHGGALAEQFAVWREGRSAYPPTPDDVALRDDAVDDPDELWVLAGAPLAAACADRRLLLSTREAAWDEAGVTSVGLRFEGRDTILALPAGRVSVQALRGRLLRRGIQAPSMTSAGSISCPAFASNDRRLLLRGERADELVAARVPTTATGGEARPRTHRFQGPVVAAASLGRRLVALVLEDELLVCRVIGKPLGDVDGLATPVARLGMGPLDDVDEIVATLPPLFYDRGALLCRLGGEWWRLRRGEPARSDPQCVAVGPARQLDLPLRYLLDGARLTAGSQRHLLDDDVDAAALRICTGSDRVAWSSGEPWQLLEVRKAPCSVALDERCEVLGVVDSRADGLALLTRSGSGVLLRLHSASEVKTLTACSGLAIAHAVHPSLPLLAIQRDDDAVDVVDWQTGERLMAMRAP